MSIEAWFQGGQYLIELYYPSISTHASKESMPFTHQGRIGWGGEPEGGRTPAPPKAKTSLVQWGGGRAIAP